MERRSYKGFGYYHTGISTLVQVNGKYRSRNLYVIPGLHDALQVPFLTTVKDVKACINRYYDSLLRQWSQSFPKGGD